MYAYNSEVNYKFKFWGTHFKITSAKLVAANFTMVKIIVLNTWCAHFTDTFIYSIQLVLLYILFSVWEQII